MSTEIQSATITTADQLFAMLDDGNRYELVRGVLNAMPLAFSDHGRITSQLSSRLGVYVEKHNLGVTYAAGTGFRIASNPDTVRAPDASFVSYQRLASVESTSAYLPLSPDLVVEVVSPNDSSSDVEAKVADWLAAGSMGVLVADPANETIRVYRDASTVQILRSGETFEAGDACGEWTLNVDDVFG